ncbi:MAG: hypothetical protein ACYS74_09475 [Planctomycetota bacterium]
MVQIQNLTLTDKTLTLDYRVSNPFAEDIWVCQDTSVYGFRHVIIAIDGESLWMRLRFNIERDILVLSDPPGIAKYLRLRHGDSRSGKIFLDLPIMKVPYIHGDAEYRKKRKQITLHQIVLEVGYFGPKYNEIFDTFSKVYNNDLPLMKRTMQSMEDFHDLPIDPFILDETQDGQSRRVMYISDGSGTLKLEESAKVFIADVNIPCSVAVEDE